MYLDVGRCNIFIFIYCIYYIRLVWSYNVHDALMQFLSLSIVAQKTSDNKYFMF